MRAACLVFVVGGMFFAGCDRHEWESVDKDGDGKISSSERGTKELYEHDEGHKKDHSGGHKEKGHDGHGKKSEEKDH